MDKKLISALTRQRALFATLLLIALIALIAPASAQTGPGAEAPASPEVTQSQIESLKERVESASELDEAAKSVVTGLLDQAAIDLQTASAREGEANLFDEQIEGAGQRLSEVTELLATPEEAIAAEPLPDDAAELERALNDAQSELTKAEQQLAAAASEPSRRQGRLLAIPQERAAIEAELADLREQLAAPAAAGEVPLLTEARRLRLQSQLRAGEAELAKLQNEKSVYAATANLLPLERQLAERNARQLRDRVAAIQQRLAEDRKQEIDTLRERVLAVAGDDPATLSDLARENLSLLNRYQAVETRSDEVRGTLVDIERVRDEVRVRAETTTKRVLAVGLTDALALLLQRDKNQLNALKIKYKPDPSLRSEIRDLQLETFRLEDQTGTTITTGTDPASSPLSERNADSEDVQVLETLKAEILSKLVPSEAVLFQQLVALDTAQRELRDAIDGYLLFIEENLLWTRNSPFIAATNPSAAMVGLRWLISPQHWAQVPRQMVETFKREAVPMVTAAVVCLLLFVWRFRWLKTLRKQSSIAKRKNCVSVEPTIRAAFMTVLMAAPLPLLLALCGWVLSQGRPETDFAAAVGRGCYSAAAFVTPFYFLCQLCRSSGLGVDHFGWPERICQTLRQAGRDIATLGGALILVVGMLRAKSDNPAWDAPIMSSLGRYLILTLMAVLMFNAHLIFKPSRLWKDQADPNWLLFRQRKLVYAIAMLIPVSIALLCALGYEYMTLSVMSHLLRTVTAMLIVLVVQSIAKRTLLVRRRRLAIAKLQQQRMQRESVHDPEGDEGTGIEIETPPAEMNLGTISEQAQQLVRLVTITSVIVLLALIWIDLMPGLRMLDRVTLWTTGTTTVNQVTLQDLIFCLLSIAVTIYAIKSFPALVEMFFLQPLAPGARYAVTTITRYAVGALGLIFGLSFLSIPWSQLSWIAAAASVGLGFGLQEILANFVSGLILLLEQPIRVGDVITVDGSTGVVSKMQIRATTVTNWDRQELVIPNKDLVTGKLLNWTLSNVVNRVTINVGVAYGSPPNEVRDILMRVVKDHPDVLEDPAPLVTFEQFGDSSLNFVIRCYLPSLDKRLATIHDLHAAIAEALEAADIQIPFPQRDIHLSVEPAAGAGEAILPDFAKHSS